MIEPRCPECISPEIEPDAESATGRWRCRDCGARLDLEAAFVRLGEADDFRSAMESEPMFRLHRDQAEAEIRALDGAIGVLSPYSDVEELHHALGAATARGVIETRRDGAALHAYLYPGFPPHPVLGVDPGLGAVLVGPELALPQEEGEDPVSYTVRRLGHMVDGANDLLAGRLHGGGGPSADDPRAVGPRSHRPASRQGRRHRYTASVLWLSPDLTKTYEAEADGLSIPTALVALGERIEASDFDPEIDIPAINLTLSWKVEGGDVDSTP